MPTPVDDKPEDFLARHFFALQVLILTLVGAFLYGHTLGVPWYLDDNPTIVNPAIRPDLGQAFAALFTMRGFSRLTFALNHELGGLNPLGYHLVNIAIHLAAAGVVLLLLRRVFPRQRWAPLFGALLFVAHPLQTQAITYVVQRMASLSALCFLLSLYLFVRGRERLATGVPFGDLRHLACYLGALLAGLFAILAKENAAVLPLALFLWVRYFPAGSDNRWRPLLLYVAPFWLAPLLCTYIFLINPLAGGVAVETLSRSNGLVSMMRSTPLYYLFTEFSVLWIYIRLLFLPWGQALDYGYPTVTALITVQNLVAGLGLAGLLLLALGLRRKQPALSAGILWFFLTLAVESSLIPLDPLFEHRLYLPMFGFALFLPALVGLLPRAAWRQGAMLAIILILGILTWRRNALWNDPIAFYTDNLKRAPNNERVYFNLASYYLLAGQPAAAEPLLLKTLQINPHHPRSFLALPDCYVKLGRDDDARRIVEQGLRYYPQEGKLHNYLAILYSRKGDDQTAYTVLRKAQAVAPTFTESYVNIGKILLKQGDAPGAERELRRAISLGLETAEVHNLLARALERQGRMREAEAARATTPSE